MIWYYYIYKILLVSGRIHCTQFCTVGLNCRASSTLRRPFIREQLTIFLVLIWPLQKIVLEEILLDITVNSGLVDFKIVPVKFLHTVSQNPLTLLNFAHYEASSVTFCPDGLVIVIQFANLTARTSNHSLNSPKPCMFVFPLHWYFVPNYALFHSIWLYRVIWIIDRIEGWMHNVRMGLWELAQYDLCAIWSFHRISNKFNLASKPFENSFRFWTLTRSRFIVSNSLRVFRYCRLYLLHVSRGTVVPT